METFTEKVIQIIKNIPKGKVASYGQIATLAGSPRAARQVVRILHSSSKKHNLPWHRVLNSQGNIALKKNEGFEVQKGLLENEKVKVSDSGKIDLEKYLWTG
ncbi:MAG: methylated-DNA--[protein]-cysteine S-methyltransferase [Calditrichaeota bacterium]|nr:MAG: methylated-DNA--[protein]-cysteine S-methyltransferase [Calditrichota bacterium]